MLLHTAARQYASLRGYNDMTLLWNGNLECINDNGRTNTITKMDWMRDYLFHFTRHLSPRRGDSMAFNRWFVQVGRTLVPKDGARTKREAHRAFETTIESERQAFFIHWTYSPYQ